VFASAAKSFEIGAGSSMAWSSSIQIAKGPQQMPQQPSPTPVAAAPGAPVGAGQPKQTNPTLADATLTAAVGPGQPNKTEDVKTVQRLLSTLYKSRGITESGVYDAKTQDAVGMFERFYFNGDAHPFEPDNDSFACLKSSAIVVADIMNPILSHDIYQLAASMVPGGVGKLVKGRARPANGGDGPIRKYLPSILKELNRRDRIRPIRQERRKPGRR
jgi:hypothetical protein